MTDTNAPAIQIEIITQGAPRVASTYLTEAIIYCDIVFGFLDMNSKRCTVFGWGETTQGAPAILIGATEDSLYLGPDQGMTEIAFPTLPGFSVELAEIRRYTLTVVLTKRK